jgi:hypothetical protein
MARVRNLQKSRQNVGTKSGAAATISGPRPAFCTDHGREDIADRRLLGSADGAGDSSYFAPPN